MANNPVSRISQARSAHSDKMIIRSYESANGEGAFILMLGGFYSSYRVFESKPYGIASEFYRTYKEAESAYEDLLASRFGCAWVPSNETASGVRLLEVGNILDQGVILAQQKAAESGDALNPLYGSW